MTFRVSRIIAGLGMVSALLLAGCAGGPGGMPMPVNNAQTGAITGSVLGGVLGHQLGEGKGKDAATILGTIIGGYIGGAMGAQMDAQDRTQIGTAVATGQPATWQNPNTGYQYTATPGRVYQSNYQSRPSTCRPVTVLGQINGRAENIQLKACQDANGQWQATE